MIETAVRCDCNFVPSARSFPLERVYSSVCAYHCPTCGGHGRVSRPMTADHILTDTKPWATCSVCGGSGRKPTTTTGDSDG